MARITEKKPIDIDRTCVDNPIYVTWLNTRGGFDHWLFKKTQVQQIETTTERSVEPYAEDIENAIGYIFDLETSATPRMTVGAHVPVEKVKGIAGILYSKNVLVLMNPDTWTEEGPKWQSWRPLRGTFRLYNTDEKSTDIEITFEQPYINIQAE